MHIFVAFAQDSLFFSKIDSTQILNEVNILEKKMDNNSTIHEDGFYSISAIQLKRLPKILGENDILKATQFLPGVQSGNEGVLGFFVRGGSPEQNLLLYDNIPIYNATHLYGFISTVNGDAIETLDFYKNYVPVNYAGRLATTMNIDSKNGNKQAVNGSITLGLINAKFSIDGPIKNKKTTFSIYGRCNFIGAITKKISKKSYQSSLGFGGELSYYFYDINANIQHIFNDKHQLKFSTFVSHDFYNLKNEESGTLPEPLDYTSDYVQYNQSTNRKLRWLNVGNSLTWNYIPTKKWLLSNSLIFSNYQINFDYSNSLENIKNNALIIKNSSVFKNKSFIRDFILKSTNQFNWNTYCTLIVGTQLTIKRMQVQNGTTRYTSLSSDTTYKSNEPIYTTSLWTTYAQHRWKRHNLLIDAGLLMNLYSVNKSHFFSAEPRLKIAYTLPKEIQLFAAANYSTQYIHLLNSRQSDILNDVWIPATSYLKPEKAWNFSFGIQQKIKHFEWSVETYYRQMNNLIDYKNDAGFLDNSKSFESQIYNNGKGKAYGVEFFVAKSKGYFTASAKYNLAWSSRQFDSIFYGKSFSFKYDKRHDFTIVLSYQFKKAFDVSLSWSYNSGQRMTIPKAFYYSNNNWLPIYEAKNAYLLPAYHRLDVSFNYTKDTKKITHQFNLSVYNVYNRKNTFSVYTKNNGSNVQDYTYYHLSIFPVLPSINYTITIKHHEK